MINQPLTSMNLSGTHPEFHDYARLPTFNQGDCLRYMRLYTHELSSVLIELSAKRQCACFRRGLHHAWQESRNEQGSRKHRPLKLRGWRQELQGAGQESQGQQNSYEHESLILQSWRRGLQGAVQESQGQQNSYKHESLMYARPS